MKKSLSVFLSLVLVLVTLPLSAAEVFAATTYTVTFIKYKATGEVYEVQTVNENECSVKPADPTMEGYTFMGWRNGNQTDLFDFTTPITSDITLNAGWTEGTWADVPYTDENGASALCPQKPYITITSTTSVTMNYQSNWNRGWYVVEGNVTLDYLTSKDTVNLILKDGATLTVNKRFSVDGSLNIFAQTAGTGSIVCPRINDNSSSPTISIAATSVLTVNGGNISAVGIPYHAAIGSSQQRTMGTLIVNGGTITATGANYAAAIGAGYNGSGGTIIINAGTVNAAAGNYGNALGGYYNGSCEIAINGGKITATGGTGSNAIKATSLSLGWTNASDFINIGGPLTAESVTVNDDFVFESDSTLLVTENNIRAEKIIPYTGPVYNVRYFDSDGITEIAPSERFASGGALTSLPTVNKYGYRFIEWQHNSNAFAVPTAVTQNIDLIAYFEQINPVSYIDENGDAGACCDYTEININSDNGATYGAGWYVLTGNSSFSGRLVFSGEVNLILADGLTLTAQKGITVSSGSTFTVYGQSNQTGALTVGTPDNNFSGIGGVQNVNGGTIVINGGVITSTGGKNASAIGGGGYSGCENVIINNGTVSAIGGQFGSGIGGGAYNSRGDSTVTVNGGTVNVNGGQYAAGIGYGYTSTRTGSVTINGGTVTATAGNSSAAIGGGQNTDGGVININGGNISALIAQSNSFGMGAGKGKASATVNLNWSRASDRVFAVSYNASECNFIKAFKVENTSAVVNTLSEISNTTIVPFTDTYYTVDFLDSDGITKLSKSLFAEQGGLVSQPETPVRSGYRFAGWTLNNASYDFSTPVSGNIQLIASWQQAEPVDYIDENGETQTCDDYTYIESTSKELSLSSGWYVVDGNITVSGRISVSGTVGIIIKDGANASAPGSVLTASKGIAVNRGNTLNIYGQAYGTGTLTTGTPDSYNAGIGGSYGNGGGAVNIYGANINARGGSQAAGIGSGYIGSSGVVCDGTVTINAGNVTSVGGSNGAGIGSGMIYYSTNNTTVTVNGGNVYATGGNQSAGIGGGYNTSCGTVNINGGYVEARGGSNGNGIGGNGTGTINLSWTELSDRIFATSYNAESINILKDFRTDNPDEPATISNIGGRTLIPFCLQYDINEDGIEDLDDIGFIISASVEEIALTTAQTERADLNGDTVVDAFDAAWLDRYLDSLIHPRKVSVSSLEQLQTALNTDYVREVIVTTAITLPDGTVLDGAGKTVRVEKPYVREDGTLETSATPSRVFSIESGSHVSISNMTVMGGEKSGTAAISLIHGYLTMENVNVVRSNRGLDSNGTAILKNCNFSLNVCKSAGAIWTGSGAILVLDGCSFTKNRSDGGSSYGGGAIGLSGSGSYLYANNTVFADNASQEIGGAINVYDGNAYLMNCTVTGNCTSNSASYGGGIGKNGGSFYAVNCLFTDNYATIKSTPTRSDIGKYSGSNSVLYNCLYGTLQGSATVNDCKTDLTDTVANEYANSPIILSEGTMSVNFVHPVLSDGKYVAVNSNGNAATGGINTYFDYSDINNVRMGYGTDDNIVALGGLNAPDSGKKVTSYLEGGTRDCSVIGASACG